MASERISDMPSATIFNVADILPIVQGGANKSCTRDVFLTAQAGETIELSGNGGLMQVAADGSEHLVIPTGGTFLISQGTLAKFVILPSGQIKLNSAPLTPINIGLSPNCFLTVMSPVVAADAVIRMHVVAGGTIEISHGSASSFLVSPDGSILMATPPFAGFELSCGGAEFTIDQFGQVTIRCLAGLRVIVGTVPGDSAHWMGDPDDLATANDRIAAAVAGLLGGPIP